MGTEEKYITGFNAGYLMAEYESNLSDNLATSLSNTNDFFQGFFDGKEQLMLEDLHKLKVIRKEKGDVDREITD